jgi:hypothetical protein
MAAPLNTYTTIEQRGVVRFLWAKNMDAAKDIHKEMLPICLPACYNSRTAGHVFIKLYNKKFCTTYQQIQIYAVI